MFCTRRAGIVGRRLREGKRSALACVEMSTFGFANFRLGRYRNVNYGETRWGRRSMNGWQKRWGRGGDGGGCARANDQKT
jgi:hypothetical protein